MAEEVKLIGSWGSPFSRRVEIALRIKGVQYEYIEEDLYSKSELLLKSNPVHGKVPVLLHNGKAILESLLILEYIDETWKDKPLLPEDPCERNAARFWARFIDDKLLPALWNAWWCEGQSREMAMKEASTCLKLLENELKGKKFFGGDSLGYVDISANFLGFWVGIIGEVFEVELLNKEKFPTLCKWREEYLGCSAVNIHLPPKDKLLDFFRKHLGKEAHISDEHR